MINTNFSPFNRHGKTILQLMQTLLNGQEQLNDKGEFTYIAVLNRLSNIEQHCKALDYFVRKKMIDSYSYKQYKDKPTWYVTVHKNKEEK